MSWAQLTNRPNNGSQGYYNNNNNNNNGNANNNNWNRNNNSNNDRKVGIRTINNLHYSNSYRSNNNKRNNNRNQYNRNKHKNINNNSNNNNNNNNSNNHYYNNNQPPRRSVGVTGNKKKHNDVNYVILDSGAFIGRQSFFNNFTADTTYYMTSDVQNEIRDKQSRHYLESFPYHITIKNPDPKSITYGMLML